jgi:predicted O-methyltransferase YrrM
MKTKHFYNRFLPNQKFYSCLYKDQKTISYNRSLYNFLTSKNNNNFDKIKFDDDDKNNYISMASSPLFINFLIFIIKLFNIRSVLEVGTYIGLSSMSLTSYFLKNKINIRVTTIEKFDKFYYLAKNNFKKNKLDKHIDIYHGRAVDVLPDLKKKFDLIFLDGGKIEYFQTFLTLEKYQFKKNSIVIIDDMFFHGSILNKKKSPEAINLLKLTKYIFKKKRYEKHFLPFFGGILFIKVLS